jgi:hypothetical protein
MDSSAQYGQQNFNLPHDVVKLPSGGVFYKSKKKGLKVGYLTAADENLLMAGNTLGDNSIITTLLRSKIYESDIKPEELLQGDIQAILIFLRNTAFGPDYEFTLTDPETGKQFNSTISLEQLFVKNTGLEPNENGYFETKLPKSGKTVKLRPLSYGELVELDKMAENYPQGRIPPKSTWKLQKMIVEMEGISDKSILAQNIESLPIQDSKFIKKFIDENEPSLELNKKVITPSGKEVNIQITFGVEFFRPFF